MPKEPSKPDDKEQSKRFIDAAKELGADADSDAFGRLLGRIAPVKPAPPAKKAPKKAKDA